MSNAIPTTTDTDNSGALELYSAPVKAPQTDDSANIVKAWLARIAACMTYAALVALHPSLAALAEPIKARLRTAFTSRREFLVALRDLVQTWTALWGSMAAAVYQDMEEHGGKASMVQPLPEAEAIPEVVAEEHTDRTIAVTMPDMISAPVASGTLLETELGAIATEAQANAEAAAQAPSLAGGQMAGVGYTTVQGYITALRQGVKAETARQYKAILRGRGMTQAEVDALQVTIIPEAMTDARPSVQVVHHATGPSYADVPRAQRAEFLRQSFEANRNTTAAQAAKAFTSGQMVAGAVAEGAGVMLGWSGMGEMRRSDLVTILTGAGFPEAWAPSPKSPMAHAGFALGQLNVQGHIVRADRGGRRVGSMVMCNDGVARRFLGRWKVVTLTHATTEVGAQDGRVVLTAVLTQDGRLEVSGPADMATRVREDYARRVANDVYPAGEVTLWLRMLLMTKFGAVRMGGTWYVKHEHAATANRLCEAICQSWGTDWIVPALPVATSDQLRTGLSRGLIKEAAEVLADLESQREQARKAKKAEIGHEAAGTLAGRLKVIAARIQEHASLLGESHLATCKAKVLEALAVVEPLTDGSYARFNLIAQEMGW